MGAMWCETEKKYRYMVGEDGIMIKYTQQSSSWEVIKSSDLGEHITIDDILLEIALYAGTFTTSASFSQIAYISSK
jgi:hypothetical protein